MLENEEKLHLKYNILYKERLKSLISFILGFKFRQKTKN